MPTDKFHIDHTKVFPTLPNAPIVEAVLHWQAAASVKFDENALAEHLKSAFPDYTVEQQHNLEAAFTGTAKGMEFKQTANWEGVRLTKLENNKPVFVCQFKADGIVFSRLAPYLDWGILKLRLKNSGKSLLKWGNPLRWLA